MVHLKNNNTALFLLLILFALIGCSDSSTGIIENGDDDGSGNGDSSTEFNSSAAPGSSAEEFLRADTFTELAVEVHYMSDFEPRSNALDSLKTFLEARLNKTMVAIRTPTEIPSGGEEKYSAAEIRELESQNRDHFTQSGSNTLQAYFLIVDGEFEAQSNVLGIAYFNTSMAFFGKTIEEVSSGFGAPPPEKIEGTVFRHEFGHVMGLVGNGTPLQSDHKTEGSEHCTTDGCLMEPNVRTSDFFANTFENDIPDLKQFCIEDLQANGGK